MKAADLDALVDDLRATQRQKVWYAKSEQMNVNRLEAAIAGVLGYTTSMTETERAKKFAESKRAIKDVLAGGDLDANPHAKSQIFVANESITPYRRQKLIFEKEVARLAKGLPICSWVSKPEQRGFGVLFLGIVVGECGNLSNFAAPAKVWARFGLHPYTKVCEKCDGNGCDNCGGKGQETLSGSSWAKRSKKTEKGVLRLNSEDWVEFGYCKRRRAIAYQIGCNIVRQNGPDGPYYKRYSQVRELSLKIHSDWWHPCRYCKGKLSCGCKECKKQDRFGCAHCRDRGIASSHAHAHAMQLATKLLLKNMWAVWNPHLVNGGWKATGPLKPRTKLRTNSRPAKKKSRARL